MSERNEPISGPATLLWLVKHCDYSESERWCVFHIPLFSVNSRLWFRSRDTSTEASDPVETGRFQGYDGVCKWLAQAGSVIFPRLCALHRLHAMIHVLTVHWVDDRWVDIQLSYLRRYVAAPFKVYAFLNYLKRDHRSKFFYTSTEKIRQHDVKLNLLADVAALHAGDPDDWLMFLDGDAFPIGDVVSYGRAKLNGYPLAAVQRRENFGDIQPHPSFCLTTVGFWKEIGGDWRGGHKWKNNAGQWVSDVGGNLLAILERRGIDWFRMLRSNEKDLHPLWFGIYDDLVYHHGAGFRKMCSRLDFHVHGLRWDSLYRRCVLRLPPPLKWWLDPIRPVAVRNQMVSDRVLASIVQDPFFYRYFQKEDPSAD